MPNKKSLNSFYLKNFNLKLYKKLKARILNDSDFSKTLITDFFTDLGSLYLTQTFSFLF